MPRKPGKPTPSPNDPSFIRADINPETFPQSFALFDQIVKCAMVESETYCRTLGLPAVVSPLVAAALFAQHIRRLTVFVATIRRSMAAVGAEITEIDGVEQADGSVKVTGVRTSAPRRPRPGADQN